MFIYTLGDIIGLIVLAIIITIVGAIAGLHFAKSLWMRVKRWRIV